MIVVIANEQGLPLSHFDIKQAFVRAKHGHTISMPLADGCGDLSDGVIKLTHALYGLKQAGRQWKSASRRRACGIRDDTF